MKFPARPVLLLAGFIPAALSLAADLPRSTPEAQGVSSATILSFVTQAEAKIDAVHSFMLVRHGQVVAEGWWAPYAADKTHRLFSLTKSFTSTAVGLAIAEGKLNLEDPVLKFFPKEALANPSPELKAMTVRHLLRMSTGHDRKDVDAAFSSIWPFKPDLVKKFLEMPIARPPGTGFVYDSLGSHMLSVIVQRATGQTVKEYLKPRLFAPLGIAEPEWETDGSGVPYGGVGLHLHTEDLAKFGQLYLQKGRWQDRQLLPAAWVEAATSKQTENRQTPDANSDWDQGYGYQFWMCRHGFYRGDGAVGQFCIVMPQYDAVLAITSGTQDMGSVMQLAWDVLIPAFKDAPLPADPAATAELTAKTKGMKLARNNGLGGF